MKQRLLLRLLPVVSLISFLPLSSYAASPTVQDSSTIVTEPDSSGSSSVKQKKPAFSPEQHARAKQWSSYLHGLMKRGSGLHRGPPAPGSMPVLFVDPSLLPYMPMKFPDPNIAFKMLGLEPLKSGVTKEGQHYQGIQVK
jgi:hypothetical protein